MKKTPQFYQGVLDGSTPLGNIIKAGKAGDPGFASPPAVVADPDRRSLLKKEWISEFSKTTSLPAGHGFNLVDPGQPADFACYSFLPKANLPLKVIVLDDTQSATDGSKDIHGHGYLDAARWAWLKAELAAGQAADQLMIVAAPSLASAARPSGGSATEPRARSPTGGSIPRLPRRTPSP
jgi:hypothetical protein